MCNQCKIKPIYEFTNKRTLCKTCFIHWFDKKFFYTIRKFKMINSGDRILCKVENHFRNVVLRHILNYYCSKSGNLLLNSGKRYDKIALANSLDLNSFNFIKFLREDNLDNLQKFSPVFEKKIYPLYLFSDKEILLYAELKKLRYKKEDWKKTEEDSWIDFINELEKKHPEIKNAIMNSYLKIIY